MNTRQCFVIVGGGQAGAWACKTLRDEGFDGELVIIGAEIHPPYERPPLSKDLLAGNATPESTRVFPQRSYEDWGVELRLGSAVSSVDTRNSTLSMADGTIFRYDRLLLATGGTPRKVDLTDTRFENVYYLRSIEDSLAIQLELKSPGHVLIIGGGWIGLEVAATARKLGSRVTIAESASVLCGRAAPRYLSHFLYALHHENDVEIILNACVATLEGSQRVERVRFSDGAMLEVSSVIVGVGLCPSTQLAEQAGIHVDNGIVVNELCQTSHHNIFAAGDVANFRTAAGKSNRIESWDNAQKQGIAAGRGMLGKSTKPDSFPWFWSDQYGRNVQLIGELIDFDETITLGDVHSGPAMSLCFRQKHLVGAVAIDSGRNIRLVRRALQSGQPLDIQAITQSFPSHQQVQLHDAQR